MASAAPSKSQPLHDFNLPSFKNGNSSGHPQRRRSANSPLRRRDPSSLSTLRQSPLRDSLSPSLLESQDDLREQSPEREKVKHTPMGSDAAPIHADSVKTLERNKRGFIEYRRNRSRNPACQSVKSGVFSSSSEQTVQKSEKRQKVNEDAPEIKKSKFLIKIPCKNKSEEGMIPEGPWKIETNDKGDETDGERGERQTDTNVNEETKTRILRPRKPVSKCLNVNAAGAKTSTSLLSDKTKLMSDKNKYQSPLGSEANRSVEIEGNSNGAGAGEKKVKRKLSISIALSKMEIEEDIFSMTGSKPRRKPKKRAKNTQKQVDYVFPGMWLVSITQDSYKVSENYLKG